MFFRFHIRIVMYLIMYQLNWCTYLMQIVLFRGGIRVAGSLVSGGILLDPSLNFEN
jgi:hypothetical protein